MPQLEFADFVPQLAWLAATFIVLYVLMARLALPRIGRALEERQLQIGDDLGRAEKLRAEAEHILTAYNAALADARSSAQNELRRASDAVSAAVQQREEEFSRVLLTKTQEAERAIAASKAKAMGEVNIIAADLATQIAGRLTGMAPDAAKAKAKVSALAEGVA